MWFLTLTDPKAGGPPLAIVPISIKPPVMGPYQPSGGQPSAGASKVESRGPATIPHHLINYPKRGHTICQELVQWYALGSSQVDDLQ